MTSWMPRLKRQERGSDGIPRKLYQGDWGSGGDGICVGMCVVVCGDVGEVDTLVGGMRRE